MSNRRTAAVCVAAAFLSVVALGLSWIQAQRADDARAHAAAALRHARDVTSHAPAVPSHTTTPSAPR